MSYFYSDPSRESDPYALPDCEVFCCTKEENEEYGLVDEDGFEYDEARAPYHECHWYSRNTPIYSRIPDRERAALKRLTTIIARYPALRSYVQTDPRGAALYVLREGDIREGKSVEQCYSRGIAVYR